jgi:glyoxylase-like metal-dependent hydrolase (beta-lactamase superfamily II)
MLLPDGIHVAVRGWLSANQVFLQSQSDSILDVVDSGFYHHENQTVKLIHHELHKIPNCKVGKLLNTHLHSDHCGGNKILQEQLGFEVWIPEASWDIVTRWDEDKLSYKAMGQPCPRYTPNHALIPGEKIELGGRNWHILAAPGHDHHSIMLYQEQLRVLISADALWENGFGSIIHELYDDGGFPEVKDTLDLISSLDISLVIPGHGTPFTDVKKALENAYSRLAYLASDPKKNALHVAKVLLSYKIMELQKVEKSVSLDWFSHTPIFIKIAKQLNLPVGDLFEMTLTSLVAGKVVAQDNQFIQNID